MTNKGILCPNHAEPLEIDWPMKAKGNGVCPVSGAGFAYEAEVSADKVKKDTQGNLVKSSEWKVTGDEE